MKLPNLECHVQNKDLKLKQEYIYIYILYLYIAYISIDLSNNSIFIEL